MILTTFYYFLIISDYFGLILIAFDDFWSNFVSSELLLMIFDDSLLFLITFLVNFDYF